MRVLTFTSLFPNPSQPMLGIFVAQRVAALARRPGVEVEVIAPVPYFPSWACWSARQSFAAVPLQEKYGDIIVHHPRYLLLPKISMSFHGWVMFWGSLSTARRLHRHASFDCIDAHYVYPDGFAGEHLGRKLGIPTVISARGTDINLFPTFRSIRPQILETLEHAAGIIAVSAALKKAMENLGTPTTRIEVIANGVDTRQFHRMDQTDARRHLGLPADTEILLSVGGLAHHKGFHLLIDAITEIAPRHPSLRLYIVGEGMYRTELESQIRARSMQERIHLVGSISNEKLLYWYNAASITCLASLREGMPNVLIESLACGTPVVATRVGGIPEVIRSSGMGVLVDCDSPSIGCGIEQALASQWDREWISMEISQRTWDVVGEEVESYLVDSISATRLRKARATR